eukprot:snap_masked-scaffold_8-processed-gene-10.48-mRNA-1 protein AED:1.00 eAED:1.00 QI:0/-1/0/0/-1/1/1/0/235
MSNPKGVSNVALRRKWDEEEYRKKAIIRQEKKISGKSVASVPVEKAKDGSRVLSTLEGRLADDVKRTKRVKEDVGVSREVSNVERPNRFIRDLDLMEGRKDLSKFQGYLCDVCGMVYMDSASWTQHLNSKVHLSNLGVGLDVKKSSLKEVRRRIRYHVERKLMKMEGKIESVEDKLMKYEFGDEAKKMENNELQKRIKRKEAKKAQKEAKQQEKQQVVAGVNEEMMKLMGFAGFK